MVLLAGLVGMFAVPGLVFAAALAAARLVSRWLALPVFRPFRDGPPGATGKRLVVRSASVAAAFAVCFLLAFGAARRNGRLEPTTRVTVVDGGPAQRDGMKDGDRIVAIDSKAIATWDAVRAQIGASAGPRTIGVERGGERLELTVTPTAGRIGVEERPERRDATFGESASDAFRTGFAPLRAVLPSVGTKATLTGPVGIVKAARGVGQDQLGSLLALFGMFASFSWAAVVVFHAFDAVLPALRRLGN
jgi:membrane-associated protease RseP (regulator of RpoE activity)